MNTANLQLEGLYVAVTALAEALREKGLLTAEDLARSLDRAEDVASRAAAEKDISPSNIEAIVFPVRYLKLAVSASAEGRHLPFHEVARMVGESKPARREARATVIRRDDELAGAGAGPAGAPVSETELLDLARRQEAERDA